MCGPNGTADFWSDVAENWQSEYLQFLLFIWVTVYLVQKGSPESKELGTADKESDKDQKVLRYATAGSPRWAAAGGWRTALFSSSLALTMGAALRAVVADSGDRRSFGVQRGTARTASGPARFLAVPRCGRLLEPDVAELAVGVPRRRLDGRALSVPQASWVTGIQARWRPPRVDRGVRLTPANLTCVLKSTLCVPITL